MCMLYSLKYKINFHPSPIFPFQLTLYGTQNNITIINNVIQICSHQINTWSFCVSNRSDQTFYFEYHKKILNFPTSTLGNLSHCIVSKKHLCFLLRDTSYHRFTIKSVALIFTLMIHFIYSCVCDWQKKLRLKNIFEFCSVNFSTPKNICQLFNTEKHTMNSDLLTNVIGILHMKNFTCFRLLPS